MTTGGKNSDSFDYSDNDFDMLDVPTPEGDSTEESSIEDGTEKENGDTTVDTEEHGEDSEINGHGISVSVGNDSGRNPKSVPVTGFFLRDKIYKFSWPGRERFDREESLILRTHPHWLTMVRGYAVGLVLILGGMFAIGHYLTGRTQELVDSVLFLLELQIGTWFVYLNLLLIFMGFLIFVLSYVRRLHTWYIVTDQRVWVRKGVLSKKDLGSLNHHNLNNVEEKNPFPLNWLGIGHIELFTASTDGAEVEIKYVADPSKWTSTIRNEKQNTVRDGVDDNEMVV